MLLARPLTPWHWLLAILTLGLGFRLLLAYVLLPDSSYWSDVALFASWAHSLAYHGPGQFYGTAGFADYPPGYLSVLWLVGLLSDKISADDVFLTRLLVKLPSILADVGVALALYFAAQRIAGPGAGLVAALVYLFNPITWLDSALWGQNDALGALALTLAVLALVARQPELAAISSAAAILTKPQFAILAPVVALVFFYRYVVSRESRLTNAAAPTRWFPVRSSPVRLGTSVAAGLAPLWILPALFGQGPLDLVRHMRQQTDLYPYASMSAFNPWAIVSLLASTGPMDLWELIPWLDDRSPLFLALSSYALGLALFGLLAAFALWRLWRRLGTPDEATALWACSGTLFLGFFVLATRMHERYAFPFFALALPLVVLSWPWSLAYGLATLGCLGNMYVIYALSWVGTAGYSGPDPVAAVLATPLGIGALSVINSVGLAVLLAAQIAEEVGPQTSALTAKVTGPLRETRQRPGEELASVGVELGRNR